MRVDQSYGYLPDLREALNADRAASVSSEMTLVARTYFCTSARCNQQASIQTTSGKVNG